MLSHYVFVGYGQKCLAASWHQNVQRYIKTGIMENSLLYGIKVVDLENGKEI